LIDEVEQIRWVHTQSDLDAVLASWTPLPATGARPGDAQQIGLVLLMENGDAIRTPEAVEEWYAQGLRIVGPAWIASRYCGGAGEPGPLTPEGFRLLEHMQALNMILDTSHMAEQSFFQAVDRYAGPIIASHANPRHYVDSDRHLSDKMIHALIERDGVIGIVPFNMFLVGGWRMGDRKEAADLSVIVRAIDYVCQRAGNAQHVALGTDFDGGFGNESIPAGLDTIADLQKIAAALQDAGYSTDDIDAVMSGNWIRILRKALPN
jgi:membrane dipeptidase